MLKDKLEIKISCDRIYILILKKRNNQQIVKRKNKIESRNNLIFKAEISLASYAIISIASSPVIICPVIDHEQENKHRLDN